MSEALKFYAALEAYKAAEKRKTLDKLLRSFTNSPSHVKAYECCAPVGVYLGGWRGGKTSIAIIGGIAKMADRHPGQLAGVLAKSPLRIRIFSTDFEKGHRGVIQPRLEQYLPDDWKLKYSLHRHLATITPPGKEPSTIQFCTYNQSVLELGGVDLDLVICDEMPLEEIFLQSRGRLLDRNGRLIIAACPDYGLDWSYYGLYLPWQEGNKDIEYVKIKTTDNVDEEGKSRVDMDAIHSLAKGMTKEQKSAKIDGNYVALSGLVWPELCDDHIKDFKVPAGKWTHFWCMDYHTRTPCYALSIGMDSDKRIWVYDEAIYQLTLGKMVKAILLREQGRRMLQRLVDVTAANPERGGDAIQTALEKLDQLGLRPLDPVTLKDTSMSCALVRDALAEGRLIIHPSCRGLITQMKHYQWQSEFNKRKLATKKDRVQHYDCHFSDIIRYLLMYGPYWRADSVS